MPLPDPYRSDLYFHFADQGWQPVKDLAAGIWIVPFFTTSFLSMLVRIPRQEFELCQTLGFSRWESLYEVVVLGKADQVVEIVRQNFAIAWMMITMVEGLSMSEGGIGALLIKYNKYNDLASVIALQGVIFGIGLCCDYLLGALRHWLFPYTRL